MLAVKAWIMAKAKAYAPLTTVLGHANRIEDIYPTNPQVVPALTCSYTDAHDHLRADDTVIAQRYEIEWHAWGNQEIDPSTIIAHVDALMLVNGFSKNFYTEYKERQTLIRHSVARYARSLTSADLI